MKPTTAIQPIHDNEYAMLWLAHAPDHDPRLEVHR